MNIKRTLFPLLLAACLSPAAAHAADSLPDEVELGFTHDALDKNHAPWNSVYLDGSHRFGDRNSVYGELRETDRFSLHDREVSGGYYLPLGASWTALVEASISPDHNVLPKDALFGQVQKSFDEGWDVQAGLRRSEYTTAGVDVWVLTGERYWGSYRAAYKLYLSKLESAGLAPSHNAQLSYYYTDRDNLTLSLAKGIQVESLGPALGVLSTDVTTVSLSGRHWLDAGWGVSYEAIQEREGTLYTRKGIRVGLRHAF
jgi:YaiO family outer membrane protein